MTVFLESLFTSLKTSGCNKAHYQWPIKSKQWLTDKLIIPQENEIDDNE